MRLPRHTQMSSSALFVFLLPHLTAGTSIDCTHARADGMKWNLEPLGGPKSVVWSRKHPPTYTDTTFTIDICQNLVKTGPKGEECPIGTQGMPMIDEAYFKYELGRRPDCLKVVL